MRCELISQWRARVREGGLLFGCDLCHISVLAQSSICICRSRRAPRPSASTALGESQGDNHGRCSVLCCGRPRRMDDQVRGRRIRSLRESRRRDRCSAKAGHARRAPMCAWWMMTVDSDRNGPAIEITIRAVVGLCDARERRFR